MSELAMPDSKFSLSMVQKYQRDGIDDTTLKDNFA